MGIVYILHLERPFHHAKHYTGFSQTEHTLKRRIEHHLHKQGAKFTKRVVEAGISFSLALKIKGRNVDRNFERKLKNTKNAPRYCPFCNPDAKPYEPKKVSAP